MDKQTRQRKRQTETIHFKAFSLLEVLTHVPVYKETRDQGLHKLAAFKTADMYMVHSLNPVPPHSDEIQERE